MREGKAYPKSFKPRLSKSANDPGSGWLLVG